MIALASDHAGFDLKEYIKQRLLAWGYAVEDRGCFSAESASYVQYGELAARDVAEGRAKYAILVCGTGLGISMVANKVDGIRAALCTNEFMARMARMHNDANVLALGARVLGCGLAEDIARAFLDTKFEGGRHAERVALLMDVEKRH